MGVGTCLLRSQHQTDRNNLLLSYVQYLNLIYTIPIAPHQVLPSSSPRMLVLRLQPDLPLILLQSKLRQSNPRHHTRKHKHARHDHRPMLNMPHIQVIRSPRRRTNRRQAQRRNHVPAYAVVLVNRLCVIHPAVQLRHVVLREAHDGLDVHQDVEREPEDCVRAGEMLVPRACFVQLDDDQAGGQRGCAEEVEEEVCECACALLRGRVRGLKD